MEKRHWIHRLHLPAWIVGVLALTLILRIPSFFEPYYYGDEMIYLTLGQGVRHGIALYSGLHDNKPPLLYLAAALAGNLFWFKAILTFWLGLTIVAFWRLTETLFPKNTKLQKVATIVFALFATLPLLEGNIVNAELFMIGFSILAFYVLFTKKATIKNLLFAGGFFGIGTLFKVPAAFDLPVIIAFWVITEGLKNWKGIIKKSIFVVVGFLIPILLTFIWYFFTGHLPEYIKAAFLQNVGYVSSFRPEDVQKSFLVRNFPLLIRASLVAVGFFILWFLSAKKKISANFTFFSLWLIFSLFAVTLSERPYPHYLVQSIAPISVLAAMLLVGKSMSQIYAIVPLAIATFVPFYYHFYHYPTATYYLRFINFATGKISKDTYLSSFSPTVNRNYKIADFLTKSSTPSQTVFMWDPDAPTVYALSRRFPPIKYVADYHIMDFSSKEKVADDLWLNPPKFIILTPDHPFEEITSLIKTNYVKVLEVEGANIWSKINEH